MHQVDNHNLSRQHELALEEKWVVQNAYMRLCTTQIGMTLTDGWKASRHHLRFNHPSRDQSIKQFAGKCSLQLLMWKDPDAPEEEEVGVTTRAQQLVATQLSLPNPSQQDDGAAAGAVVRDIMDGHPKMRLPKVAKNPPNTGLYQQQRDCKWCSRVHKKPVATVFYCGGINCCEFAYCQQGAGNSDRNCFYNHARFGIPKEKAHNDPTFMADLVERGYVAATFYEK